jgi:hypothetical protein
MKTRRVGFKCPSTGLCNRVNSQHAHAVVLITQTSFTYSSNALTKHAYNGWTDYILTIHAVLRRAGMLESLHISRNSVKNFVHNVHNGPKIPQPKKTFMYRITSNLHARPARWNSKFFHHYQYYKKWSYQKITVSVFGCNKLDIDFKTFQVRLIINGGIISYLIRWYATDKWERTEFLIRNHRYTPSNDTSESA